MQTFVNPRVFSGEWRMEGDSRSMDSLGNWREGISRSLAHSAVLNKIAIAKSKNPNPLLVANHKLMSGKFFIFFVDFILTRSGRKRIHKQSLLRICFGKFWKTVDCSLFLELFLRDD